MIARMPELSLSETSARLKPSRLSISSWLRTRSAPPLAACDELGAVVDHGRPLRGGGFRAFGGALGGAASWRSRGIGLEREPPFGGERVLIDLVLGWLML